MGNLSQLKDELSTALHAKTPLILIDSNERQRVKGVLAALAGELNREIDYYTDSRQFVGLLDKKRFADAGRAPYTYMEDVLKKRASAVFAVADVKYIESDNAYNRQLINLVYLAKESGGTVILVTGDDVWQQVSQLGIYLKLDLPETNERVAYIKQFLKTMPRHYKAALSEEEIYHAATLFAGFSELQLDILISSAMVSPGGLTYERLLALTERKSRIYGKISSISQVYVDDTVTVAGLENLKEWLTAKRHIFFAHDDVLKARALTAPKGILLGGIPGCGKSLSAKMIAKEWQLPLYRFDLGAVFDKYVGESEKNMRLALGYIDNVSPCVMWVDEIEKMLSVSDSGNETSKRILGHFLYWLQESKSRVFLVATANEVSLLPPELFRKGRLSEIFFLGLPGFAERLSAIRLYVARCIQAAFEDGQYAELAKVSEGFSYADIETVIKESAEQLVLDGQSSLRFEDMRERFKKAVPISRAAPEMIERITKWGSESAVAASKKEE